MKTPRGTVVSIAAVMVLIHMVEDTILLSIGRFLPLPVWSIYVIGLSLSTVMMTGFAHRIIMRKERDDHTHVCKRTGSGRPVSVNEDGDSG